MARSYDIAILSQKVEQMEGQIAGNDVIANPSGTATTLLKKIGIDGTNYNVPHTAAQIDYDSSTSTKTKIDNIDSKLIFENLSSIQMGTNSGDHRLYIIAFENAEKTNYLRVDFQTDVLRFRYFVNGVQQFEKYVNMLTPTS